MKKISFITIISIASAIANAQIASDNAGNYGGTWTNGSNGGTGFGAWAITASPGNGFAGNFIGNPTSASIVGMGTQAFGLFANPLGSNSFVNADRTLSAALGIGETFSFVWGINFDSGAGGNKGFNLYVGGIAGTQVLNVNNAGSSVITLEGNNVGFGYGTNAMTWSFTRTSAAGLSISANDRDGSGSFSTNLTLASSAVDGFRFYASQMQSGDAAQPYFNNFSVVPEPSTIGLAVAGLAGLLVARRRKQ
jgi:hypothetical protein